MAATVYMFLRSPGAGMPVNSVYREVRAYGPYQEQGAPTFSPGWVVEIDPSQPDCAQLYAVMDGVIEVWPYRADIRDAVALKLTPSLAPAMKLLVAHGMRAETPQAFLYLNVDAAHLAEYARARIAAAKNPANLLLEDRLNSFMGGADQIDVKAGDPIGKAAPAPFPAPSDAWPRVEFQVLTGQSGEDNHLDPAFFYALIKAYAGPGSPFLAPVDQNNNLLSVTAPRVLLEARTEYNTPYSGDVSLSNGGSQALIATIPAGHRGHLELPHGWSQYVLRMGNRRLTELPAGTTALSPTGTTLPAPAIKTLVPPSHWVVQSVDPDDWFNESSPMYPSRPADPQPGQAYALRKYTEGNCATALIDGIETYEEMFRELMRISRSDHFVYLANWWLADDFPLVPGNPLLFQDICKDITQNAKAQVRALVWFPSPFHIPLWVEAPLSPDTWPNAFAANRINQLPNGKGKAILDRLTREVVILPGFEPCLKAWVPPGVSELFLLHLGTRQPIGSHHQKLMVINNDGGLAAFCGGIDLKCNRLQEVGHRYPTSHYHADCDEPGYHDVHCKVEGPATMDFLDTFRQRWTNHPECPPGDSLAGTPPVRTPPANHFVQVARTYPAGLYPFAPQGDRTLYSTLQRAILRARKYIYIEDQYLVALDIREDLLRVIERISHLTILITRDSDLPQGKYRRREFIAKLRQKGGGKVRVFWLRDLNGNPLYLHSKITIIDDIFATIGSANMDHRGYTFDSEINAFVLDGEVEQGARKFARELRIRLWAEHLGFYNPFTGHLHHLEGLSDPIASAELWFRKNELNCAVPYDETSDVEEPIAPCRGVYDEMADPDGSA